MYTIFENVVRKQHIFYVIKRQTKLCEEKRIWISYSQHWNTARYPVAHTDTHLSRTKRSIFFFDAHNERCELPLCFTLMLCVSPSFSHLSPDSEHLLQAQQFSNASIGLVFFLYPTLVCFLTGFFFLLSLHYTQSNYEHCFFLCFVCTIKIKEKFPIENFIYTQPLVSECLQNFGKYQHTKHWIRILYIKIQLRN